MSAEDVMRLHRAALAYAEHGWPPFPVHPIVDGRCGCIDRACTDVGKHPVTRGWQRSIASPAAAASAWRADASVERGIGIALGPRAGVWALDIDPAHDGDGALEQLIAEHGELPETWTASTGGGGTHYLWRWPDGEPIRNSAGKIASGIDVRGAGGFIVVAPSMHASGRRYRWTSHPGDGPAIAPDWLVELARGTSRTSAANGTRVPSGGRGLDLGGDDGQELELHAGDRHDQLMRFCCTLRSIGLGEQAIVECGHALLRHHAVDDDPERPIDLAHAEKVMRDIARRYRPDGWRS